MKTARCPEFFKIYIPDLAEKEMRIPPDFITKLRGIVPRKFWLEVWEERGRWEVSVELIEEDYYFVDGWREFRQDNKLKDGDFMTFCLIKETEFSVTIFAPNGCLKFLKEMLQSFEEDEGTKENDLETKEEEETEEHNEQIGSSTAGNVVSTPKSFSKKMLPSHGKKNNKVNLPMQFIHSNKLGTQEKTIIHDRGGLKWEIGMSGRTVSGPKCRFSSGWQKFYENHGLKTGDEIEFKFVRKKTTKKLLYLKTNV